jgi:hypothetical protein
MRQFSIRQYVGLVTLVPMIVIAVCLEFIFLSNNFSELDSNTVERAKLLANQLGSSSEYGVVANNQPFLQNLAQSVSQQQDVRGAAILNSTFKILAETGNISGAEKAAVLGAKQAMPDSSSPVIHYFDKSLFIFQPIMPQTVVCQAPGCGHPQNKPGAHCTAQVEGTPVHHCRHSSLSGAMRLHRQSRHTSYH